MLRCSRRRFLRFSVHAHFLWFLPIALSPNLLLTALAICAHFLEVKRISTSLFVLVATNDEFCAMLLHGSASRAQQGLSKVDHTFPSSGYPQEIDSEKGLKVQAVCLEGDPGKHSREGAERQRRQEKGALMNGFLLWATRAQGCRGPCEQSSRMCLSIVRPQDKEAGVCMHQSHFLVVEGFSLGP